MVNSKYLLFLIALCSCSPYRYISIETYNPAEINFPVEMRRILVVNNALPQDDVPFESSLRRIPESDIIVTDSVAFDFCRTLAETLSDFQPFDDVRLLEGCYRKDFSPLSAPIMKREDVELLSDEHEADIVISLDRLLFRLNEHAESILGIQTQHVIYIEISGVLRLYMPGREAPMAAILLTDTVISDLGYDYDDKDLLDLLFSADQTNLLRASARYLAYKARTHFIPYWSEDDRWYYVSFESRWKEAAAYAESEKWDKALDIWKALYEGAKSWKQRARLCSNIALGLEMTGDLAGALEYAKLSHQLMLDHLGADDTLTKNQENYITVLTGRLTEEPKLRLQIN